MNRIKRYIFGILSMILAMYCAVTLIFVQDDAVQAMLSNAFIRRRRTARPAHPE